MRRMSHKEAASEAKTPKQATLSKEELERNIDIAAPAWLAFKESRKDL